MGLERIGKFVSPDERSALALEKIVEILEKLMATEKEDKKSKSK